MIAEIINRGRGPEIAGTRITVYDVMDYSTQGWHRDRIAGLFRLSSNQIQAALDYIEAHAAEVNSQYEAILERSRNYKYSPEVQAKVDACRGLASKRLAEIRARRLGNDSNADNTL